MRMMPISPSVYAVVSKRLALEEAQWGKKTETS